MDFKQIETFINVVKYKSFSKAAVSSFVSQPAISSHIASLEKDLKVQLFDRTSKEIVLTTAGESFLSYAIDILNIRDKARIAVSSFNDIVEGDLYLSASTTPCNTLVPKLLADFHASYPNVHFNVNEMSSGQVIEDIIRFDSELGIVGEDVNDEKIDCFKLVEDELVVISPVTFKLPSDLTLKDLLKYDFIMREKNSGTRKTFEDILHMKDINLSHLKVPYEVNSLDTILQFVKSGLGVSVVSSKVCSDYVLCGLMRTSSIKNIPMARNIYLITSSKRTLTPTARAFFNMCKEKYNQFQ